jgi:hypothetical protein
MQPRATQSVKDRQEIRRYSIVTTETIRRCMLALLAATLLSALGPQFAGR